MTQDEFNSLADIERGMNFQVSLLSDKTPRTLLLGYTCERETWHVYLGADRALHRVVYSDSMLLSHTTKFERDEDLIPDKRLYPEACDFETCRILAGMSVSLPFTTFGQGRVPLGPFAAKVYADLEGMEAVFVPSYEVAECFYATVKECNENRGRANQALAQACEELKEPYRTVGSSGVYIKKGSRAAVFERARELFPDAQELSSPEAFLRHFLHLFQPFEDAGWPMFAHAAGGTVTGMVELDLASQSGSSMLSIREVDDSGRLAVFYGDESEPSAWLTPAHKGMSGKQPYSFEQQVFGKPLAREFNSA